MKLYNFILLSCFGCSCTGFSEKNRQDTNQIKITSISSFEKKLVGNWKLNHSSYLPIKLPNFNGEYKDLTLEFDSTRKATFYLDNLKDSVASYEWNANQSTITFLKGDVIYSSPLIFISDSLLSFTLHVVEEDTLLLRKFQ